ncbi:hypothetical protein BV25DRAFT_1826033 [Artomyces pyxidatus]|uniref:Uncharacterized protein n=1 Tax=Artomyces pyxidatus TaxID=48021 RepID=A0ACB8T1U6_9AGAM|nr:hypothetical protein BV25DRAFT_1826033 [Artomyces pyxidatus]
MIDVNDASNTTLANDGLSPNSLRFVPDKSEPSAAASMDPHKDDDRRFIPSNPWPSASDFRPCNNIPKLYDRSPASLDWDTSQDRPPNVPAFIDPTRVYPSPPLTDSDPKRTVPLPPIQEEPQQAECAHDSPDFHDDDTLCPIMPFGPHDFPLSPPATLAIVPQDLPEASETVTEHDDPAVTFLAVDGLGQSSCDDDCALGEDDALDFLHALSPTWRLGEEDVESSSGPPGAPEGSALLSRPSASSHSRGAAMEDEAVEGEGDVLGDAYDARATDDTPQNESATSSLLYNGTLHGGLFDALPIAWADDAMGEESEGDESSGAMTSAGFNILPPEFRSNLQPTLLPADELRPAETPPHIRQPQTCLPAYGDPGGPSSSGNIFRDLMAQPATSSSVAQEFLCPYGSTATIGGGPHDGHADCQPGLCRRADSSGASYLDEHSAFDVDDDDDYSMQVDESIPTSPGQPLLDLPGTHEEYTAPEDYQMFDNDDSWTLCESPRQLSFDLPCSKDQETKSEFMPMAEDDDSSTLYEAGGTIEKLFSGFPSGSAVEKSFDYGPPPASPSRRTWSDLPDDFDDHHVARSPSSPSRRSYSELPDDGNMPQVVQEYKRPRLLSFPGDETDDNLFEAPELEPPTPAPSEPLIFVPVNSTPPDAAELSVTEETDDKEPPELTFSTGALARGDPVEFDAVMNVRRNLWRSEREAKKAQAQFARRARDLAAGLKVSLPVPGALSEYDERGGVSGPQQQPWLDGTTRSELLRAEAGRARAREERKAKKVRVKEIEALLILHLGELPAEFVPADEGAGKRGGLGKVIFASMPQLVARMTLKRRDTVRSLANRKPPRGYVHSPLSDSVVANV